MAVGIFNKVGNWFNKALWGKLVYDFLMRCTYYYTQLPTKNTNGLICNTHNTIGDMEY